MNQTRELRALDKSYEVFTRGADPDTVIRKFYSNGLLTPEERERAMQRMLTRYQQLEEVFKGLRTRVFVEPSAFNTAVQLLLEEPALGILGKKMQGYRVKYFTISRRFMSLQNLSFFVSV